MNAIAKYITAITIIIFILIGVSGCMNTLTQKDESIRDEILTHLKAKYNGQEFEALSLERGFGNVLHCYPKNGNLETDNVKAEMVEKNGEKEFNDTFFGIIIRDNIETEIISYLSNFSLPMKTYFNDDSFYYDNSFDGTKTYDDLKQWILSGNPCRFTITIIVLIESPDKQGYAKQIFDTLQNHGFQGMVHVCMVSNGNVYEKITKTNLNEVIKQEKEAISLFSESIN